VGATLAAVASAVPHEHASHVDASGYAAILRIRYFLFAAVACAPALAQAGPCGTLAELRWLIGDWVARSDASEFRETWTEVSDATFEGVGVELASPGGRIRSSEALRLVQMAEGVYYVAKVAHNTLPVAFRLSECGEGRYIFENPSHDFPRKIEYMKAGEGGLTVRVGAGSDREFTLAFAPANETPVADGLARRAAVLAAEDARFAAMIGGLRAEMQPWLAADLRYVHSTGEVETRDQLIESIASGARRYLAFEPGERRVTFLDRAAAIVQGPAHMRVAAGAGTREFDLHYLAVYVLADGAWQLLAWQSVPLPETP
jgi:Domain of unknown function (DUF6265)/Domain of unknown function (DUF4440)